MTLHSFLQAQRDRETARAVIADDILALTTTREGATNLRNYFYIADKKANAETAVKVAGATAKHCIVIHGDSTFLSGEGRNLDYDQECFTRANVAYSRATDLTILAYRLKFFFSTAGQRAECPYNQCGLYLYAEERWDQLCAWLTGNPNFRLQLADCKHALWDHMGHSQEASDPSNKACRTVFPPEAGSFSSAAGSSWHSRPPPSLSPYGWSHGWWQKESRQ